MNRAIALVFTCGIGFTAGTAVADCQGDGFENRLTGDGIDTAFSGQAIDANANGKNWKEIHCTSPAGELQKVGRGPTHPVDPQKPVGTWSVTGGTGDGLITYDYGPGNYSYTWAVYENTDAAPTETYCWENAGTGAVIATGDVTGAITCVTP